MHVQTILIETAHDYPMRRFFAIHAEGADQNHRDCARFKSADQISLGDIPVMDINALLGGLALETNIHQLNHLFFSLITHAVNK